MAERSVSPPLEGGGGEGFKSYEIACLSCEHKFIFSSGEQRFYKEKGLINRPKRCRSCRFARKEAKSSTPARLSVSTPAPLRRPELRDRPTYSLPITTHPGLVLESDRKGFIAAVDPGRILRVGSARLIAPGTYVTFTKTTTKGDFILHEVLEGTPPHSKEHVRMKASVVDVAEGQVSLRAHFNNAILTCTAPDFEISQGMRVLFSARWSSEGLRADHVTGPDESSRSPPSLPRSAWKSHFGPWGGSSATSFEYSIIHPSASASLARALGYTHDLCCHPKLSPASYAFADDSRRGAVPKLSLLRMEELALPGSWSSGQPRDQGGDSKVSEAENATYVLIGTRSTGHLLAQYLRKSLSEIDALGLERRVIVLYPIEEGTTAQNFYGTTSSKLFQSKVLPITKVEVLTEPVLMAKARTSPVELSDKITACRMVAVHYEISSRLSLPSTPPVTELTVAEGPLAPPGDALDFPGVPGLKNAVRFSVPKGVLDPEVLRGALPEGALLHTVGHAMGASYTTYEAVFATEGEAKEFLKVISVANQTHKTTEQWLAAPLSDYWGGDQVFTIFTSKLFQKDEFYKLFKANWAFAVNHTQIRFNTDLTLSEICRTVDQRNSTSRGPPIFYRLSGDARGIIHFDRKGGTLPRFPSGGMEPPSSASSDAEDGFDDDEVPTFLHNVPRHLPLTSVEELVSTLAPQAEGIKVLQQHDTLCVQFAVPDLKVRAALLDRPCRKLGKHYLYLSDVGPDPDDTAASYECSGARSMENLREALKNCEGSPEGAAARPDEKEYAPFSSSSPDPEAMVAAPREPSSTAEGKSASHPSPMESLRILPFGLTAQLASRLPSEVTDRPDLANELLDEYNDEALCEIIRDSESLPSLVHDVISHVRERLADGDTYIEGHGPGGPSRPADPLQPDEATEVPDTQDAMICNYRFASTKTTSQRDRSLSDEQSQPVLTPDRRSSKKQRNQ